MLPGKINNVVKDGLKAQQSHSPGQCPGYNGVYNELCALQGQHLNNWAFALAGRGISVGIFTQGAALGYVLLPLRGVLLVSFDSLLYKS